MVTLTDCPTGGDDVRKLAGLFGVASSKCFCRVTILINFKVGGTSKVRMDGWMEGWRDIVTDIGVSEWKQSFVFFFRIFRIFIALRRIARSSGRFRCAFRHMRTGAVSAVPLAHPSRLISSPIFQCARALSALYG